jgi:hypothetical protein
MPGKSSLFAFKLFHLFVSFFFFSKLPKLKEYADKINFKMRIDPAELEKVVRNGDPDRQIKGREISSDTNITPYTPFEYSKLFF